MSTDFVELDRLLTIPASNTITVGLECSVPYGDYTAWVFSGAVPNLSVQPKYGGVNDGAAVVVNAAGAKKVFAVAANEIRPSTNIKVKNPGDDGPAPSLKPELAITNNDSKEAKIGVYMVAITPGGL